MEIKIALMNFLYAILGAMLTIFFMYLGFHLFDKITNFDTHVQLREGNIAVGIVVGSVFLSIGIAIGLVIGLGLN